KTPPLWGIGLIKDVNGHTRLLHDGRANGVLEAILWHGGEAQGSKDAVLKFNEADRQALVKFVESLRCPCPSASRVPPCWPPPPCPRCCGRRWPCPTTDPKTCWRV